MCILILSRKIKIIITNKVIYSDDALAIEKLEAKIDSLTEYQNKMKNVNAYYKKHKTLDGCDLLDEKEIRELKEKLVMFHYYSQPYPSFELTNNNQNLHRLKDRLENLKKFRKALLKRKDFHYHQFRENSQKRDVELAMINYLLGNFDDTRESLEYITSIIGEREHFNKIISLCRAKKIDYDYINNEITENRLSLRKYFKNLPVNPDGYFGK